MSAPSFRVYVDESGDEGFVFNPDGSGSSRWLVLSAVITRRERDLTVVKLMDDIRALLGRQPRQQLHFVKLNHAQRTAYARELGKAKALIRTVSILIHKPSIQEPETFQAQKHQLYRYACRLLLERVSWLCRDHRIDGQGDGTAEIIFSNRGQMSYDDLRDYLARLREMSSSGEINIEWSAINPDSVRAVQHSQLAGLQLADAVASSAFAAVNANRYGDTESRYLLEALPVAYRHEGRLLGYGLKLWPGDLEALKTENPQLVTLAGGLS